MASTGITFIKAEPLTWAQSMHDIDGNIGTVVFQWGNAQVSFKREQLNDLLGALHFITGSDEEVILTRNNGNLVNYIDGEFFPLGADA